MVYFESIKEYLESSSSTADRINKIDAVIDALILKMIDFVENEGFEEYEVDTGQTTLRTKYRSLDQVQKSVHALEKMRQMYANRLTGRVIRLMDGKNFNGTGV